MPSETSQNGWPVLDREQTRRWEVPGTKRGFDLQSGNAGFILIWLMVWFDEKIERLDREQTWDDWGWAPRDIRDSNTISNHASGTAVDANSLRHPMGVKNTFKMWQRVKIRWVLRVRLRGAVRWGGTYRIRKDDMHFEINTSRHRVNLLADKLRRTKRGKRIVKANQRVIREDPR